MSLAIPTKPLAPVSSATRLPRFALRLIGAALFVVAALFVQAAEPTQELRPAHLRLLYSESLFSRVNRNDALAAIETWLETLGQRRGFQLTAEIGFFTSVEEAAQRVREKTVDVINCTSVEYLDLATTGWIEPMFFPAWNHASDDYVLFFQTGASLGRLWMEANLGAGGLGSVDEFFGSNSETTKPSSAVLPVFFGKTDAAVATRYGWETMKEMNPQLGTQLEVVTHSPSLPDAVVCFHRDWREHPFGDDLYRATVELDSDPQGRQILLLFKTDKMVPYESERLEGVRALVYRKDGTVKWAGRDSAVTMAAGDPEP